MSLLIYYVWLILLPFLNVSAAASEPKNSPADTFTLKVTFTNIKKDWYKKKMYMAVWKKGSKGFPGYKKRGFQHFHNIFTNQSISVSIQLFQALNKIIEKART